MMKKEFEALTGIFPSDELYKAIEAALLCRGSFPATLEENGEPCIVEASIYRLNAVAAAGFMLDGPESLLLHLGLSETDTYITKHDIDDLVTVVRILRKEADTWQL